MLTKGQSMNRVQVFPGALLLAQCCGASSHQQDRASCVKLPPERLQPTVCPPGGQFKVWPLHRLTLQMQF